jgi:hypothetical protein
MPRLNRRGLRRKSNITPGTVEYLRSGHWFGFLDGVSDDAIPSEEDAREAWESVRDELIAQHAAEAPGSRPAAYWRWDAKRPEGMSEREYLTSHGLLSEREQAALARMDAIDRQIAAKLAAGDDPADIAESLAVDVTRVAWRQHEQESGQ